MVWLDPDRPEELFDQHWLASSTRPAPLRFRGSDYGTDDAPIGSAAVRTQLATVIDGDCDGPVRMLTQARRWGWLFNPITLYFAWSGAGGDPVGVVAEVTNTPWHERHRYAVPLDHSGSGYASFFEKSLHVSPFLGLDFRYLVRVEEDDSRIRIDIDVIEPSETPILETRLIVDRHKPTPRAVRRMVLHDPLATYRVSGGIHANAARIWRKGIPFVPHPRTRKRQKREVTRMRNLDVSPRARNSELLPTRPEADPVPDHLCRAARRILVEALRRITDGTIEVIEDGEVMRFGSTSGRLKATVRVIDSRTWWAIVSEGSIGLGRGFIEGWWHSDDPVAVVRVIIANTEPLQKWRKGKVLASALRPRNWRTERATQTSIEDREDIAAHYDIGTDFFSVFLDDSLTYSAGVFPSDKASLHEASINKYDRLLDKLDVGPGDRVLEIGTGWGGFAIHAASTRGCHVTTTTISADQYEAAGRRVRDAGLGDSVELLDVDWRDVDGTFDRVVAIEMIEAVDWRDYGRFFAAIERCLAPDGVAGIQAICVPGQRYDAARRTEDFIKRFVFPGGGLPSLGAIASAVSGSTKLHLTDVEDFSAHYAETLARWRAAFDLNESAVAGLGFDNRFVRLWRFYLAYCEAAFAERHVTVNQLVLVGPAWRPDGLALRPA